MTAQGRLRAIYSMVTERATLAPHLGRRWCPITVLSASLHCPITG